MVALALTAKQGEDVQTGFSVISLNKPEEFSPQYIVQKAVKKAIDYLDAQEAKSGQADVVLRMRLLQSFWVFLKIFARRAWCKKKNRNLLASSVKLWPRLW